jgi:CRP-like cAMP-binding protein
MSKISKQELIRLQKTLVTDPAIGEKLSITRQGVFYLRKKYGIESRYVNNPKRNASIIAAYKKGTSREDLAKNFGLSIFHTSRIIKEAGAMKKPKTKSSKTVSKR